MKQLKNKHLIFDLGAVIIDLKSELNWWQEDMLTNFDNNELLNLFKQYFFRDFEKGLISVDEFLSTMQQIKTNDNISVEQAWNGILKTIPNHRIDLLKSLKENNKLYLLSNTNHIHFNYITNNIINDFGNNIFDSIFDIQFCSQNIGMRKPDDEIYHFVQNEINATANDFYFFDDKIENLSCPKQLGWNTILVDKDIAELIV